ncbi:MAG: hypothetical protein GKR87_06425 [Kiritimatiellae bacterium]|nr:hypothetical protein [Kiritimatiellia bacterium]
MGSRDSSQVVPPCEIETVKKVPCPKRRTDAGTLDWKVLKEAARTVLRVEHYAYRTEKLYLYWIRRFLSYHYFCKPSSMTAADVHQFLSYLAVNENVTAETQNQALNAIVFLFRNGRVTIQVQRSAA